jgi:hypothetical protein
MVAPKALSHFSQLCEVHATTVWTVSIHHNVQALAKQLKMLSCTLTGRQAIGVNHGGVQRLRWVTSAAVRVAGTEPQRDMLKRDPVSRLVCQAALLCRGCR